MSAALIQQLRDANTQIDRLEAKLKEPAYPNAGGVGGSAHGPGINNVARVRKGESVMSSRPFRLLNLFGFMGGHRTADEAKIELDHLKAFNSGLRDFGWGPAAGGVAVPLGMSLLPDQFAAADSNRVLKSLLQEGTAGADPDEMSWIARKVYNPLAQKGYFGRQKAQQSWLDETLGGPLVAPPEFGEIIELLRNQEALVNAGARTIQLPAQGTVVFPRITSPSTAGTYSENVNIASSTVGTGHLTLSAKKIASMIQVPNELFRFATAAAESILRNDMTKTLALQADLYFLEGNGQNNVPKGIIGYNGTNEVIQYQSQTPAPKGIGVNGNTVLPEDGYRMAALVEENNAMVEGWVMRPSMWSSIGGFRADAVTAGDAAGVFVQSLFRAMGDNLDPAWCGFPITKTNQVSRSQQKGTASNLTYIIGGMWSDFLIGLFGAIEFLATNTGSLTDGGTQVNAFSQDLTLIRGIMLGDSGPRHSGAFVYYPQLLRQ